MSDTGWCRILSTEGHQYCRDRECDCPCHLPRPRSLEPRRPHSFPREDWRRLGSAARKYIARRNRRQELGGRHGVQGEPGTGYEFDPVETPAPRTHD